MLRGADLLRVRTKKSKRIHFLQLPVRDWSQLHFPFEYLLVEFDHDRERFQVGLLMRTAESIWKLLGMIVEVDLGLLEFFVRHELEKGLL
jgi:hypothetical protein